MGALFPLFCASTLTLPQDHLPPYLLAVAWTVAEGGRFAGSFSVIERYIRADFRRAALPPYPHQQLGGDSICRYARTPAARRFLPLDWGSLRTFMASPCLLYMLVISTGMYSHGQFSEH